MTFIQSACCQNASWEQSMGEYISFRNSIERFSGSVLIAQDGEAIYTISLGQADRAWKVPVNDSTKYDLASVTKMFTAIGVAKLYEEGKILLNGTISEHFPGFPNSNIGESTTIRQLLSHTSGLSDFFMHKQYQSTDRYRLRELSDYDRFYTSITRSSSQVGEMHYSNTNFMILGRIIEIVSGQDYYTFIQEQIFEPLNMSHTGFYEHDLVVNNLAENYTRDAQASTEFGVPNDDRLRRNSYMRPVKGMPAGGAFSTTADLLKFFNALNTNKLISKKTYEQFIKSDEDGYALGFQSYNMEGIHVVGHSGGFYGVSTQVFFLPEQRYTVIILSNTDFGAMPVFSRFIHLLNGREINQPISLSNEILSRFEGTYEIIKGEMSGKQLQIKVHDRHLLFDNELEFYPYSQNAFYDIDNETFTLKFQINKNEEIIGFQWSNGQGFNARAKTISEDEVLVLEPIVLNSTVLKEYLGSYKFGDNGMMPGHQSNIEIDGDMLLVDGMMRFIPFTKDKFFLQDDVQMQLHFLRNEAKEITGFNVRRGKEVIGIGSKLE